MHWPRRGSFLVTPGLLNGREQTQLLALLRKIAEGNDSLSRAPHKLP